MSPSVSEPVSVFTEPFLTVVTSPSSLTSFAKPMFRVAPSFKVTVEANLLEPTSKIPPLLTLVLVIVLALLSATMAVPDTSILPASSLTASLPSIPSSAFSLTSSKLSRMKVEPSFTAKIPIFDAEPKSVDTDVLALIFNVPAPARVLMVEPALFTLIFELVSTLILASMIPPFKSTEAFSKATSEPLVALIKAPSATLTSLLFKVIVPVSGASLVPLAP